MSLFLELLVNGIALGGVYALVAIGFALPYGTSRILHLAHGATISLAVYIYAFSVISLGLPSLAGVLLALAVAGSIGFGQYCLVYRPLAEKQASLLIVFLSSLGILLLAQHVEQLLFGANPIYFPYGAAWGFVPMGNISISKVDLLSTAAAVVLLGGVLSFMRYTQVGKSMRALASNRGLAELVGIDVRRIDGWVFGLGAVLGVPGALIYAVRSSLYPQLGFDMVLVAAVATIIGGVGRFPGAIIGGFLLGVVQALSGWQLRMEWQSATSFALLILILLLRPEGLMGKARALRH